MVHLLFDAVRMVMMTERCKPKSGGHVVVDQAAAEASCGPFVSPVDANSCGCRCLNRVDRLRRRVHVIRLPYDAAITLDRLHQPSVTRCLYARAAFPPDLSDPLAVT